MVGFRFIFLIIKRLFKLRKIGLFDACSTSFIVNPFDLDINFHMNNGRYLSIMDLGRFDLMFKSGTFWPLFKEGYYPVIVSESIRFKRSLQFMQSFNVETKIESWDEKDFYMTQKFMVGGSVYAVGYIKGRFMQRGRKGSAPTSELFAKVAHPYDGPSMSELAKNQFNIEKQLTELAK